jgi:hypothetical protein
MIARYSLSDELNSFDYYGWQAQVAAMGATEIAFDLPYNILPWQLRRFRSIIQPGPAMLGMQHCFSNEGLMMASSRFRHFYSFARAGRKFPRLRSIAHIPGPYEFTVTMRHQSNKQLRNSDRDVWLAFADQIGAHVIEDFDDVPIHLHERMRFYAGARMNFGVVSGPLTMCSLSIYPCAMFGYEWAWGNGFYEKAGVSYGDPMPWCGPQQFTVWETPSLEFLRRWLAEWSQRNDTPHGYSANATGRFTGAGA